MSASDKLPEILSLARVHLPDVPPETWERIEHDIRAHLGAERVYIARKAKRARLRAIALGEDPGVSDRRVRQLKPLVGAE